MVENSLVNETEAHIDELESCEEPKVFVATLQAISEKNPSEVFPVAIHPIPGGHLIEIPELTGPRWYRIHHDGSADFNPGDDPSCPDDPEVWISSRWEHAREDTVSALVLFGILVGDEGANEKPWLREGPPPEQWETSSMEPINCTFTDMDQHTGQKRRNLQNRVAKGVWITKATRGHNFWFRTKGEHVKWQELIQGSLSQAGEK